jgi:hypothetical protein
MLNPSGRRMRHEFFQIDIEGKIVDAPVFGARGVSADKIDTPPI